MSLTFIVPFYNAAATLETCLRSLQDQDTPQWACLCVDDGSTDGGADIVQRFIEEDSRFSLLRQENQGVAAARNRGMNKIKGGYLSFVDADDCLLPHAVSSFYEAARNTPDVVVGNILHVDRKGASPFYRHLEEKAETLPSILELFCLQYIHAKFYRTAFLRENNVRFPALHVYEDEYFTTEVLLKAEKIETVGTPLYRYCFNPRSLTNERGRSLLKKKNRLQSAILKQTLSAEARARGALWKRALDISCLEAACEVFSSLSRDPQSKRELLEMAHALTATLEPLPWGRFPRLTAYALLAGAFRHKSPVLLAMARRWKKLFPLV